MAEEDERPRPDRRRPTRVYAPVFQRLGLTSEEHGPVPSPGPPGDAERDRGSARSSGPPRTSDEGARARRRGDRNRASGRASGPPGSVGPRRFRSAAARPPSGRPTGPAGPGGAGGATSPDRPDPADAEGAGAQPAVHLDDFTQAVVNRVIKTRQRGWQPDQVRKAAAAVDATLVRELALGEGGAIGGDFESVADHLDFLRAGDAWTGRAVAVAARRIGLTAQAARLAGRIASRLPGLRDETQLWACALVLRVIDAGVRAELGSRRPDARSRGDVTEADIARRISDARRQVLGPGPQPRRRPRR